MTLEHLNFLVKSSHIVMFNCSYVLSFKFLLASCYYEPAHDIVLDVYHKKNKKKKKTQKYHKNWVKAKNECSNKRI